MPGQRAPGQRLLNFPVKESFSLLIGEGVKRCRECNNNRSEFIRLAIVERLRRLGVHVPYGEDAAPSRAGKGGRTAGANSNAPSLRASEVSADDREALRAAAGLPPSDTVVSTSGKVSSPASRADEGSNLRRSPRVRAPKK